VQTKEKQAATLTRPPAVVQAVDQQVYTI